MIVKWAIEIQKTNLDQRNLIDLLNGLGYFLIDGIQYPAFTSAEINAYDSAINVFENAKHLRSALTGPAQIASTFVLGDVIDFSSDPPKRHAFMETESSVIRCCSGEASLTITSPSMGLSVEELEKWEKDYAEQEYQAKLERQRARLEPAFWNSQAAKVLELLSKKNPSGETLYKIYELAEGNPTRRKEFHAQLGISKVEFNRFQDAVHNPTVSGDWARHAYDAPPKTDNPMSKGEAEHFVRQIAATWLKHVRISSQKKSVEVETQANECET